MVVKKDLVQIDVDSLALFDELDCIDSWNNEAKVQLALGNWGGRYKRSDVFKEEGRAQLPLYAREGKGDTAKCFISICESAIKKDLEAEGREQIGGGGHCVALWL